ncbi:DUF551 domain-containing protein [Citrobacter youngae]
MPKHVTRCGTGYAVTEYSAWLAHDFIRMWEGWNACRSAMLNHSGDVTDKSEPVNHPSSNESSADAAVGVEIKQPSSNSGWIPVSERVPGSQEWVIVFAKWANQQVLCWDDVANRWTDFEDQSYYADMFTHWMPLPAAPQQEDK